MEKKRRRRGRREESQERHGSLVFCMETMILVWILVWKSEFLWISLDFVWILYGKKENQTINQILMNLGLKELYLVYWLCFGLGLVDCNPQLRNICIKKILGF